MRKLFLTWRKTCSGIFVTWGHFCLSPGLFHKILDWIPGQIVWSYSNPDMKRSFTKISFEEINSKISFWFFSFLFEVKKVFLSLTTQLILFFFLKFHFFDQKSLWYWYVKNEVIGHDFSPLPTSGFRIKNCSWWKYFWILDQNKGIDASEFFSASLTRILIKYKNFLLEIVRKRDNNENWRVNGSDPLVPNWKFIVGVELSFHFKAMQID